MEIMKKILYLFVILAMLFWSLPAAMPAVAADAEALDLPPMELPQKGNPKLDSQLDQLVSAATRGEAVSFAQQSNIKLEDGRVRVIVECEPGQVDAATRAASASGVVETSYQDWLQVVVLVSQLTALADTGGIRLVSVPWEPLPAVISQGIELINAEEWHSAGFTGAGVKIGILDGGFTGYAALRGTELPASVVTQSFQASSGNNIEGYTNHGTACAEIVYDVAPSAQFYLVNCGTSVEMGNAVNWLISQGVNVISYSMGWPTGGPGDGTGLFCQMVDAARAAGILWVSAIGNLAMQHWQGNYVDTDGDKFHEFQADPRDESNKISVNNEDMITVGLKWNDTWGTSANNYDLFLFDSANPSNLVALSNSIQDSNDYPIEFLSYTANYTGIYHIVIAPPSGSTPAIVNFHLYSFRHILQYPVASSSFAVPSDSPNALAVGAAAWNNPTAIEPFSSRGPTKDGRFKPDLVAPDGVTTATMSPFYGTSAATPHVAGAAALLKQRFPPFTPAQLQSALELRAADLGTAGKDNLFGSGGLNLRSPFPPKIVFVSDRDANLEIYIMNADGSNQTRLTSNTAYDNMPMLSHNGTRIVFCSGRDGNREIYVMNADGTGQTRLTNNGAQDVWPFWSPDGSKIAFSSTRDGNSEIYVMNADGSNPTRLTTNSQPDNFPAWSPDGSKIAFYSFGQIWVMDANGSNQIQLTNVPVHNSFPIWSPDGTKITFISHPAGNPEIYNMNADGSNPTRLTNTPGYGNSQPMGLGTTPRIVFTSNRDGNPELYVMEPAGTNQTRLTNNSPVGDWSRGLWLAPTVVTDNADNVTANSAILNGNLTALGSLGSGINVSFDYGTVSGNYTTHTPPVFMNAQGPFSANITGLSANTAYYFRAKAAGDGVGIGVEKSFITPPVGGVVVSINAPLEVLSGDNFTATVDISQVVNFDACNYDVSFDPTVLEIPLIEMIDSIPVYDITDGQIGSTTIPVDITNLIHAGSGPTDPTIIRVVQNVSGVTGVNGTGYLAVLHFHVNGSPGQSSNITLFTNGTLSNTSAQEIPAVWYGDSVLVTGVDTTPPAVISTLPVANATNVPVNAKIRTTFSEKMNASSAQGAFSTSPTVSGTFSWAGNAMTFTPAANLAYNTGYTVTISTAAQDLAGNPLPAPYIWSFTTSPPAPMAVTTNDATDVTSSSATLWGNLDGTGGWGSVNVTFKWGTTSGALDDETSPPQTMTSIGAFSAPLSGLPSNTQYYFMAKATAGGVTVYGDELSFTTPAISFSVGLDITSSIGGANVIFGVDENATGGFDQGIDDVTPPPPTEGISAYFYYPENAPPDELTTLGTSYIPPADVLTWLLVVNYIKKGPTTNTVTITWNGTDITNIPSEYTSILLRDMDDTTTLADMKIDSHYTFSVTVPSLQSSTAVAFLVKVSKAISFDLALKAGWNLVSLPVNPGVTDPDIILKDVGWYSIYAWDPVNKKYVKPGDTGMVVGKGYWVMVLSDVTQPIVGAPVNQFSFDAPAAGWHLIGSLYSEASFAASPPENAYTKVYEWDAINKKYTSPLTKIVSGKGNWFLALGPCSVTVSPGSP